MKRIIMFLFLFLSIALYAQGSIPQGLGSQDNPYLIANLANLEYLSENIELWSSGIYFLQTADIDASEAVNWNNGQGFSPIGDFLDSNNERLFSGNYDGNGYKISNLFINRPASSNIGLFGYTLFANISNVIVEDVNITGSWYVGALVGYPESSNITKCSVSGQITADKNAGGLAGAVWFSSISQSWANVDLVASDWYSGGLAGYGDNSDFLNCFALGSVNGPEDVAGLIGSTWGCNLTNCYSATSITCTGDFGGGLIGYCGSANISACYWDKEATNYEISSGSEDSYGLTSLEMQNPQSFINAGWDFENTWNHDIEINNSYPYLRWTQATNIDTNSNEVPPTSYFINAYPNPFNPQTTLSFYIDKDEKADLIIYNIKGQKVKQYKSFAHGHHSVTWQGKDADNNNLASGVYLCQLRTSHTKQTKKITLSK